MRKGFAAVGAFRAISADYDGDVALKIDAGVEVGNLLWMERRILQVGQILRLVQQRPVMVDTDESIGQNGRGGVGIVMEFSLIPGTLQRQDEALAARRVVLLGERKQRG